MISLIIPVYNKSEYLRRCLDSVAKQMQDGVQVIVVDDGSTDGCGAICDEYKDKFEVYHKKNEGVSVARNYGIKKAKGDYITFLDADDLLADGAIEAMIRETGSKRNIIQFGQFRGKTLESVGGIPYRACEGVYMLDYIPRYWVVVWNKLYKKSFVMDNNIWFKKDMHFGEDTVFNVDCILANHGLYHSSENTVIHCWEDTNSLCRGNTKREDIKKLDDELCRIADAQTEKIKKEWLYTAINEHRASKFYRKHGFLRGPRGDYDIVYFLKDTESNEELRYSLRSVEKNWKYRNIVFYGGCPKGIKPDKVYMVSQDKKTKWDNVRKMMLEAFSNNDLTEDIWIFNDDFFIMRDGLVDLPPQYNGDIFAHSENVKRRHGRRPNEWTDILDDLGFELLMDDKTTFNYEVHKPMLINRKKAIEVLKRYPNTHGFRSLYGNYWNIGGVSRHDMKCLVLDYPREKLESWEFLSTQDDSFELGEAGRLIREKFPDKSRFEVDGD